MSQSPNPIPFGELLSLSELAGKKGINWMLKVMKKRMLNSIENQLTVSIESFTAEIGLYWCPLSFNIKVDSKTPALVYVIEVDFIAFQNGIPLQSGYWHAGMNYDSNGYKTESEKLIVPGKKKGGKRLSINPVSMGRFPDANGWEIAGVLRCETLYGILSKRFDDKLHGDNNWQNTAKEWAIRFPNLHKEVMNVTT